MTGGPTWPSRCGTFRHIGSLAADLVANLQYRRQVEHLHSLGPRAVAELLAEIGAERNIRTVIDQKLDRYSQIKPESLSAAGGDHYSRRAGPHG